ncbi:MAG: type B 50S ribosomal protein L31 [Chlamydiae bacterium]|nr:type B 50S ribosomal protein L31 [Chlamydiota bacterium]
MKKQGHPPYQDVLFVDSSADFKFVCGTTLQPKEKAMFEGKEYPVYKVSVSSASHPFFTKSNKLIDSEGRVDKFNKRYAKKAEVQVDADAVAAADDKKSKKPEAPKKALKKK